MLPPDIPVFSLPRRNSDGILLTEKFSTAVENILLISLLPPKNPRFTGGFPYFACGKTCGQCGKLPVTDFPFCRFSFNYVNCKLPTKDNKRFRPAERSTRLHVIPRPVRKLASQSVSIADAIMYALTAPSDEGAGFCEAKDWGRKYSSSCFSPSVKNQRFLTPPSTLAPAGAVQASNRAKPGS